MGKKVITSQYCVDVGDYSPSEISRIKNELTFVLDKSFGPEQPSQILTLYDEFGSELRVPRQYGFNVFGPPDEYLWVEGEDIDIEFPNWRPREGQDESVAAALAHLDQRYAGILCAACGAGKTVMGLKVFTEIKKPALVLVHKGDLQEQWQERIQEHLGIEAGIIRQGQCDWYNQKICIGMIQSLLSEREYDPAFYRHFGLLISDECHRMAAPTFSQAIKQFPAKLRLGLSATPDRKDGTENVFFWNLGRIFHEHDAPRVPGEGYQLMTPVTVDESKFIVKSTGRLNTARMITVLALDAARNRFICDELEKAYHKGRKILALSHRLEQLDILKKEMERRGCTDTGLYIGQKGKNREKTKAALAEAAAAQLIFGTYAMADEALDIPSLDTEFLLTPKADVRQAVGRIQRKYEGKKTPFVIDFVDRTKTFLAYAKKRRAIMNEVGIQVKRSVGFERGA